jgi:hypothetical protein
MMLRVRTNELALRKEVRSGSSGGSLDSSILSRRARIEKMKQSKFPPGWNSERLKRVLAHYELQSEANALGKASFTVEESDGRYLVE